MSLLRVGFEGKDNVVRISVLCVGCHTDFLSKLPSEVRHWNREFSGAGDCEFCKAEVRKALSK